MLTDTRKSPFAKAAPLGSGDVVWKDGFWKNVEQTTFAATVPQLQHMFDTKEISHVVENFKIAAGEAEGDFDGTVFGDGDFYKWMESAMYDAVKTGNQALLDQLDDYIALIGRAQQPDGYLSTKQIIGEKSGNGVRRMGDINDFEVYNFGHMFTAAALYYRLTGKDNFLSIASKTADYLDHMYEDARRSGELQTAVCPSHYMGLVELYRATGDDRYLRLAKEAIALRDSVKNGLDDNQDRIPLREHRKIIGHAVRANYLYAGLCDLYLEEGDPAFKEVLESVWEDLVTHKIYITGGCGALYNGASPYGNFFNHQLVHQAYGYAYQLPNITAYNETCANIGLVMWAYRMFLADPKAEYMDMIERVMLNTNLASISLDGLRFFYENMLERTGKLEYELVWPLHRTDYITSYCCPPNLARNLAEATEYAYTVSGNTLRTGMYGASRARVTLENGTTFVAVQETGYPYDGAVKLTFEEVTGEGCVEVALRIPVWAEGATITVQTKDALDKRLKPDAGAYACVQIADPADTVITLELPMDVRLTAGNDMIEEDRGKVCVERGPLVYCMETADVEEKELSLHDLYIRSDAEFTPVEIKIEGREVTALRGVATAVRKSASERSYLYRRLRSNLETKKVPVQLVPYFAWDNRGDEDEMQVWFPLLLA